MATKKVNGSLERDPVQPRCPAKKAAKPATKRQRHQPAASLPRRCPRRGGEIERPGPLGHLRHQAQTAGATTTSPSRTPGGRRYPDRHGYLTKADPNPTTARAAVVAAEALRVEWDGRDGGQARLSSAPSVAARRKEIEL